VSHSSIIEAGATDVLRTREGRRKWRTYALALAVSSIGALVTNWVLAGAPFPTVDPFLAVVIAFFGLMILVMVIQTRAGGASPHVVFSPEQISTTFADVKGIGPTKGEVIRRSNLFLAHKQFRDQLGGTPTRGILFEGPPGTGKTHMAKAMAKEVGVPFLFISATSLVSMWQGGSSKKIRAYFKELRKVARAEGGAIGFIEEIDAIALRRSGMAMTTAPATSMGSHAMCCGGLTGLPTMGLETSRALEVSPMTSGGDSGAMVNELLVQMQSFDQPTGGVKLLNKVLSVVNLYLPPSRRIKLRTVEPANILVIAATNRADNLDPALLRPGRFDKRLAFDLPSKSGRRELIDYFLGKKAHDEELATDERRDALAAITNGYSPVMIENLLDEALIEAVERDATAMSWKDLEHARMGIEVGIGQPVEYTDHEERLIASHEAGHATMAWLVAPERRLEILTIIKRKSALGLLAHGDPADVYTRSRGEMLALIQIAMGGQVAEEMLFGDVSTGPGGDLDYATKAAAQMVGAAGMVNTLISLNSVSGGDVVKAVLSDNAGRDAVEMILREAKASTRELLNANKDRVEALRDALLARKELIGHEIGDVLLTVGPRPEVEPLRLKDTV
jgi:ATP-dependent Zn protease